MSDTPWEIPVSPKQKRFIELCHVGNPRKPKYVLISGPRFSTKTVAALHAMVDHAYNVNHANVSIVSPTITAGDDGGCWWLLTTYIIPQWIAGDFGVQWVNEPRQKGTTKKLYCEILNKFGTISRFQLDSLQYELEAEARFKNKMCSAMYVSELSYFKRRETYDVFIETLRGPDWKENEFLFLGDTNPAEEGTDSWIWKFWYDFRVQDDVTDGDKIIQKQMALVEFTVADNIFTSKERIDEQLARYNHSEDLMARYRDGKWVKAVGNSIFFEVFRPNYHIIGEHETRSNPTPDIIIPDENTSELYTGIDPGVSNHACIFLNKRILELPTGKTENGVPETKHVSYFDAIDEVVYVGSEFTLADFVDDIMQVMEEWEAILGHPVKWHHYSDRSAFDHKDPISNRYVHQVIAQESNDRIILTAAPKGPGSVRQRVELTKKLLFEQRLFMCRSKCPNLIDSFQSLKAGKGNIAIQKDSKYKHAMDGLSYALASECYSELLFPKEEPNVGGRSGYVAVAL